MAFEKEIKEAQKVADAWMKRSQNDEDFLVGLKKNGVKWEKDNIAAIEKAIANGDAQGAADMIDESRKWLKDYAEQAEDRYKKHSDFVRGTPRDGSKGICTEIGLKDNKAPVYKAVNDAMTKALLQHTKQFKSTEAAWTNDLKPRIDLLESRLATLEKLAAGAEGQMTAYGKQFAKDAAAYKDQMTKAIGSLKPSMAEKAIKDIASDPSKWCAGVVKAQQDQLTIFRERVDQIDKLIALSEKNFNRVIKSVPEDVRKKLMFARPLKTFQVEHMKFLTEFRSAQGVFKTGVAVIEKNYPALV